MNLYEGHPEPEVSTPRRARKRLPWRFITLLVVLAGVIAAAGQLRSFGGHDRVAWRYSYNQAVVESTETGKPILVLFTADWCAPCKQMKAWVFSDKSVAEIIEAGFIPVRVDLSRQGLPDQHLADRFGVQAIPTILTLTTSGTPISMSAGYLNKAELLSWLENANERYAMIKAIEAEKIETAYVEEDEAD
ncbi:MAG: thioredoxin family protein [Phycisphaerales bacterium]